MAVEAVPRASDRLEESLASAFLDLAWRFAYLNPRWRRSTTNRGDVRRKHWVGLACPAKSEFRCRPSGVQVHLGGLADSVLLTRLRWPCTSPSITYCSTAARLVSAFNTAARLGKALGEEACLRYKGFKRRRGSELFSAGNRDCAEAERQIMGVARNNQPGAPTRRAGPN